MRKHEDRYPVPATIPGPKPGDFPLGSLESRAAARMMAKIRADEDIGSLYSYFKRFRTEPEVIYDYNTGRPISEEKTDKFPQQQQNETSVYAPLPAPGESIDDRESIDDPPSRPYDHPDVITVEVG